MNYHESARMPYKARGGINLKLVSILALILIVAISAFISSFPFESKLTGNAVKKAVNAEILFSSVFSSYGQFDFETGSSDTVVLSTTKPASLTINGDEIDVSDLTKAELTLHGFAGSIKVKETSVVLDGSSGNVYLNSIGLSTKPAEINIEAEFDSLRLSNVEFFDKIFSEMVGEIVVGGKNTLELSDDKFEVSSFKGNVFIEGNLTISGMVENLILDNDYRIEITQ